MNTSKQHEPKTGKQHEQTKGAYMNESNTNAQMKKKTRKQQALTITGPNLGCAHGEGMKLEFL